MDDSETEHESTWLWFLRLNVRLVRTAIRLAVAFAIAIGILYVFLIPTTSGFHIGYSSATDHQCMSRVVQWCK
jgi:hypothetical protein